MVSYDELKKPIVAARKAYLDTVIAALSEANANKYTKADLLGTVLNDISIIERFIRMYGE